MLRIMRRGCCCGGRLRFLGDSKLPRHDPFLALPLYGEATAALAAVLSGGDPSELATLVHRHCFERPGKGGPGRQHRPAPLEYGCASACRLRAAVAAACFYSVYVTCRKLNR